jgi:hypothetical protein
MSSSLRIIVSGLIAQYPLGGVTWDYFQYVLGLARLGHEVYYIEDTGQWPYSPHEGGVSEGCKFNVDYLAGLMQRFGLEDRWAYRFPWQNQWFGLSEAKRAEVMRSADLLLNVSGVLERPEEYRQVRCLVYIDSDPVFTQVKLARGQDDFRKLIDQHDVQFSFGEHLGAAVPDTGHEWRPTRQPVVLEEWHPAMPHRNVLTTVMNWTSYNPIVYNGQTYGQKDEEFRNFLDLPRLVAPTVLEIAVNEGKTRRTPRSLLAHKGWQLVDPEVVCVDFDSYRHYVESSKAEWSVAKNGYVMGQPGWFSCRSACYLAAGRPVIVQDTGFRPVLPAGEGLLPFTNVDEAVTAIHEVEAHYELHCEAARALAEEYFDARQVLTRLLNEALGG